MDMIRSLTRVAVAAPFVSLGWDAFLDPGGRPVKAAELGVPHPELAVIANGGAMVVAGLALAAGVAPRLSAAVLAALLAPTTLAGHAYWNETDPGARAQQRIQFLKNLCMMGGVLEVALSGGRRPVVQ
jgi:putative oxidoreductase